MIALELSDLFLEIFDRRALEMFSNLFFGYQKLSNRTAFSELHACMLDLVISSY